MDKEKRMHNKKARCRCRVVSKFYALPAVANAIANNYGHWGGWEDFIEKKKVKVCC